MNLELLVDKWFGASWCRETPDADSEGFSDFFLDDSEDYCIRKDNRIRLTWDSKGHLDVDDVFGFGESSASDGSSDSSSSSLASDITEAGCYELKILGRFREGPCESSSSISCSSHFCVSDVPLEEGLDLGGNPPKDLRMCFDELGHLVSIKLCGRMRWHIDGFLDDASSADSSSDEDDAFDLESSSDHEGIEVEVFLPIPESSSSSCDLPVRSVCEAIEVRRAVLCFDSLGHLFSVYEVEIVELPCGIAIECCPDRTMPKTFLIVFTFRLDPEFDTEQLYEECIITTYDGCVWRGTVNVPCCPDPAISGDDEAGYITKDFTIGCTNPENPLIEPWKLCMEGWVGIGDDITPPPPGGGGGGHSSSRPSSSVEERNINCCPLDGSLVGIIYQAGCMPIQGTAHLMEIPCDFECANEPFLCREFDPSTTESTLGLPEFIDGNTDNFDGNTEDFDGGA